MAPAPRKSTGPSRTRKTTGAASAVSTDDTLTVSSDTPVAVEADTTMSPMERAEAEADAADQAARETAVAARGDQEPTTQDLTHPVEPTVEEATAVKTAVEAEVEAEKAPEGKAALPPRDLNVLSALADTSGLNLVTPYPGEKTPSPTPVLPALRDTQNWCADGDTPATARVLVDGFRLRVNGGYRFARRGDRIIAPEDVITMGVRRGVLHQEE